MSGKAGPSAGSPPDGDPAAHGNPVVEGVATALSWLTVVPVRGTTTFDRITGRRAMAAAPLAGLVPGVAAALIALAVPWLASLGSGRSGSAVDSAAASAALLDDAPVAASLPASFLAGVLMVIASELLTRAMHVDGLADVADALGSYRDPAGAREILRDPSTGPMGSAAVTLTLLGQAAAMTSLAHSAATSARPWAVVALIVFPFVVARAAATTACHRSLPPMSSSGFGGLAAATQPTWALLAWWAPLVAWGYLAGGIAGVVAPVAAAAFAVGFGRHVVTRLGGINGDALGAIVQVAMLICAAIVALA